MYSVAQRRATLGAGAALDYRSFLLTLAVPQSQKPGAARNHHFGAMQRYSRDALFFRQIASFLCMHFRFCCY